LEAEEVVQGVYVRATSSVKSKLGIASCRLSCASALTRDAEALDVWSVHNRHCHERQGIQPQARHAMVRVRRTLRRVH
jgi:hypothetical protein